MKTIDKCIRFEQLETQMDQLHEAFCANTPFEYIAVDDFLTDDAFRLIVENAPAPDKENKSNDYIFARNKFENPNFHLLGDVFAVLKAELMSDRFAAFLSKVYGQPVFVDPAFVGGGLHQGGERSFLDMHADFNRHPAHNDWVRELNILIYLNQDYRDEYGGHLQLEHRDTGIKGQVAPIGNRLVIMLTKGHTLHGYHEVRFPAGQYRMSIAAYAYSILANEGAEPPRSTQWRPENSSPLKAALARVSPLMVSLKNSLFGSATVKRASKGTGEPDES